MHFGACLCRGVRFRIDAPLEPIQVCHCGQCRKAQGTPFATNIPVARAAFRLEAGASLITEFESSPGKRRAFCQRCGSPIYSRRDTDPALLRLRAGLIEEPLETRPAVHIHVASACRWWPIEDGLPRHPGPLNST